MLLAEGGNDNHWQDDFDFQQRGRFDQELEESMPIKKENSETVTTPRWWLRRKRKRLVGLPGYKRFITKKEEFR